MVWSKGEQVVADVQNFSHPWRRFAYLEFREFSCLLKYWRQPWPGLTEGAVTVGGWSCRYSFGIVLKNKTVDRHQRPSRVYARGQCAIMSSPSWGPSDVTQKILIKVTAQSSRLRRGQMADRSALQSKSEEIHSITATFHFNVFIYRATFKTISWVSF